MDRPSKPVAGGDPPLFVGAMHGVRGFAVLAVVLLHVAGNAKWWPQHHFPFSLAQGSFVSLDVLFFTTGFVLFLPVVLSGGLGDVRSFAIRRIARIGPAYWVCLLVILVAFPLLSNDALARAAHNGATDYLVHLFFLQRPVLQGDGGLGVNGPLWALSMDFAFYLLLPLIAGAYLRRPLVGLAIGLGISLAWRIAFMETIDYAGPKTAIADKLDIAIQFPLFAGDFAAGMTGAWLFVWLRRSEARRFTPGVATAVAALALAGLVALTFAAGSSVPYLLAVFQESTAVAIAFPLVLLAFVVAISHAHAWAQWPLTNRLTHWFSEISYSVYLYHTPAILFAIFTLGVAVEGNPRSMLTLSAVVLALSIVVAALSHRFVEVPARRYGRKLAARVSERSGPTRPAPGAGDRPRRAAAG